LRTEHTKHGLVVAFLAVLELIRLKQIIAKQSDIFGEVRIYRVREESLKQATAIELAQNKDTIAENGGAFR
jgi:chromatin segregation and condensation protein Rec8/ScpA/Scc1 (kleisin family)